MVFALNTVVGFACAVSVDMGFNTKHHHEEEGAEALVHIHKDGKQHVHQEKKETHSYDKSHSHEEANNPQKPDGDKGNCCNDKVTSFQQLDKAVPETVNIIHPVFFTAYISTYYNIQLLPQANIIKDIKPFVRSYHPPIPDIRIAIQSFQI
jgi:hypothetical protein